MGSVLVLPIFSEKSWNDIIRYQYSFYFFPIFLDLYYFIRPIFHKSRFSFSLGLKITECFRALFSIGFGMSILTYWEKGRGQGTAFIPSSLSSSWIPDNPPSPTAWAFILMHPGGRHSSNSQPEGGLDYCKGRCFSIQLYYGNQTVHYIQNFCVLFSSDLFVLCSKQLLGI